METVWNLYVNRTKKSNEGVIEEENRQLRGQVEEMENFLADYGLIWVGNDTSGSDESDTEIDKIDWKKIV